MHSFFKNILNFCFTTYFIYYLGFQDLHPDPFAMRKTFGSIMLHMGLNEYEAVNIEEQAIEQDKKTMENFPLTKEALKEDLEISSKHYLTMKQLIAEQNLDAIAVRCWPEFPNSKVFQGWPYLALARLATEGVYIYLYILKRNLIF